MARKTTTPPGRVALRPQGGGKASRARVRPGPPSGKGALAGGPDSPVYSLNFTSVALMMRFSPSFRTVPVTLPCMGVVQIFLWCFLCDSSSKK
jgi:hypothetical protein